MKRILLYLLFIILAVSLFIFIMSGKPSEIDNNTNDLFRLEVIDDSGPVSSWGKAVGDINGDGLVDIIVGGHAATKTDFLHRVLNKIGITSSLKSKGDLVWYENPNWKKHLITRDFAIRTDIEVSDINNDTISDLVILADNGIYILVGPDWLVEKISDRRFHDIEIADLDNDGTVEIITRNQSLFGYNDGNKVYIYKYSSSNSWSETVINVPHGEGLSVADINSDGFLDIVVNRIWLKNPTSDTSNRWVSYKYTSKFDWDDVKIDVADINNDKLLDIVLTPSESAGEYYNIAWFEQNKSNSNLKWVEHTIDSDVEAVYHSLQISDFNGDGYMDILTAEMNQSNKKQVVLYENIDAGISWLKKILSNDGLHNIVAQDIDGDLDVDFIGTNWNFSNKDKSYPVKLWINNSNNFYWDKITIDDQLNKNTLFVFTSDINSDGYTDILTGKYIYINTGKPDFNFTRVTINSYSNISQVYDYDHDGDDDILVSDWKGYWYKGKEGNKGNNFIIQLNDGLGNFNKLIKLPIAEGDFLQGINIIKIIKREHIILSWHKTGFGIQAYQIPENIESGGWKLSLLSSVSQDEALSVADIDGDQNSDIFLGTKWLMNKGNYVFEPYYIHVTTDKPDRNVLADLDEDGDVDAIVGYESVSRPGKIAWYENISTVTGLWNEHIIANVIGPMSIDVGDIDLDGDLDLVVGEHNLKHPELARIFVFSNNLNMSKDWGINVIHQGDEHHNGTKLLDYDNDGDLDIVSIGWSHGDLSLYRNPLH